MSLPFDPTFPRRGGKRQAYAPEQSIQLNGVDQYLYLPSPGAGDRQVFTIAVLFKYASTTWANNIGFVSQGGVNNETFFGIDIGMTSAPTLRSWTWDGGYQAHKNSTRVLRDPAGWNLALLRVDTPNNIWVMELNGAEIASFTTNVHPSTGLSTMWNRSGVPFFIGREPAGSAGSYFSGCIAYALKIDGLALGSDSLIDYDEAGEWFPLDPKAQGLVFGSEGWLIMDSTGTDQSGNDNHFTPVNTPTDSSDVPGDRASADLGNYARWNPLFFRRTGSYKPVFSEAGTKVGGNGSQVTHTIATMCSSGKHYAEFLVPVSNGVTGPGVVRARWDDGLAESYPHTHSGAFFASDGSRYYDSGSDAQTACGVHRIGVEADFAADEVEFFIVESDGTRTSQGGKLTSADGIDLEGYGTFTASLHDSSSNTIKAYFEADDWWGTPNSGYKPLCTAHLPAKTPANPKAQMGVLLWSGDGSSPRALTGLGFQPDLVWIKQRNGANHHVLYDSVRGWAADKALSTDGTDAETNQTHGYVSAAGEDGFTVAAGSATDDEVNDATGTYVAWCIGGLTHMTSGEIAALVSATGADITPSAIAYDADLGFAMIKFIAPASASTAFSVPNPLGQTPAMHWTKHTSTTGSWIVWHEALTSGNYLALNSTAAQAALPSGWGGTNTASLLYHMTSSSVSPGTTCIMYVFANTDAIKVGSYTGNGSTDGPFVDMGGKPLWWVDKTTDDAREWCCYDTVRDSDNDGYSRRLVLNSSAAEVNSIHGLDFVAAGMKARSAYDSNRSGKTHIYLTLLDTHFGGSNVTQGKAR